MAMLDNIKVVSIAVNLPGPAAARRLNQLGARVIKVEPPAGDPLALYCKGWYHDINKGQEIVTLDLKNSLDMEKLLEELADADLFLTASRPDALTRLGLGWDTLHEKFPNLCMVGIVGYPPPNENEPGHDLTYQAKTGTLTPPMMPKILVADMAGAEKAASDALALLLGRERGQGSGCSWVALSDAADYMAEPLRQGLTGDKSLVGGILAEYNIYQASDGWVAVAALEPHFRAGLVKALDLDFKCPEDLQPVFLQKSASEWETWAIEFDLPIVAIK